MVLVAFTATGAQPVLLLIVKEGAGATVTQTCLVEVEEPQGLEAVSETVYVPPTE